MFKKRIGPDIHPIDPNTGKVVNTSGAKSCPDIWELENGDIAIIGLRKTSILGPELPQGAGYGPDEEIVVIPRQLILNAKTDISKL